MPTLKQLIEELEGINIDPSKVRLPGEVYDALVAHAEDEDDDDEEEDDKDD